MTADHSDFFKPRKPQSDEWICREDLARLHEALYEICKRVGNYTFRVDGEGAINDVR